jgi:hypothetical protein
MRDFAVAHADLVFCLSRRFCGKPRALFRTPL